jgi:glutamine synthetase
MVGSSLSISGPNFILNTIVADALSLFADELEKAENFNEALHSLVKRTIEKHDRIIFNFNNYSKEWLRDAEERGLLNLLSTPDALPKFTSEDNIAIFEKHNVLSRVEIVSRTEILLENYVKTINIEALTMIDLAHRRIVPAVIAYTDKILGALARKQNAGLSLDASLETKLAERLSGLSATLQKDLENLENVIIRAADCEETSDCAKYYGTEVFYSMQALRGAADELETIVGSDDWPLPSYAEILYSVK